MVLDAEDNVSNEKIGQTMENMGGLVENVPAWYSIIAPFDCICPEMKRPPSLGLASSAFPAKGGSFSVQSSQDCFCFPIFSVQFPRSDAGYK